MTLLADLSYGWQDTTGAQLVDAGFAGVLAYIGCNDTGKNVAAYRLQDWLAAGLQVGLVIENGERDLLGGQKAGAAQGQAWLAGAAAIGYDVEHCIGYCGADFHTTAADEPAIADAFAAFAAELEGPAGLYGSGPMLDYLAGHEPADGYWNSGSSSYGPPSSVRNLQQLVQPGPAGLPVDVNVIIRTPLYLMEAEMPLTPADFAGIQEAVQVGVTNALIGSLQTMYGANGPAAYNMQTTGEQLAQILAAIGAGGTPAGSFDVTLTGTATPILVHTPGSAEAAPPANSSPDA